MKEKLLLRNEREWDGGWEEENNNNTVNICNLCMLVEKHARIDAKYINTHIFAHNV